MTKFQYIFVENAQKSRGKNHGFFSVIGLFSLPAQSGEVVGLLPCFGVLFFRDPPQQETTHGGHRQHMNMDVGKTPEHPALTGGLTGELGEETADAVEEQEIGQIFAIGGIILAANAINHKCQDSQRKQALDPPNGELVGICPITVNAPSAGKAVTAAGEHTARTTEKVKSKKRQRANVAGKADGSIKGLGAQPRHQRQSGKGYGDIAALVIVIQCIAGAIPQHKMLGVDAELKRYKTDHTTLDPVQPSRLHTDQVEHRQQNYHALADSAH